MYEGGCLASKETKFECPQPTFFTHIYGPCLQNIFPHCLLLTSLSILVCYAQAANCYPDSFYHTQKNCFYYVQQVMIMRILQIALIHPTLEAALHTVMNTLPVVVWMHQRVQVVLLPVVIWIYRTVQSLRLMTHHLLCLTRVLILKADLLRTKSQVLVWILQMVQMILA